MTAKRTTEEFVIDAEKVHSGRYDYSRVEYVNSHNKVAVVCPDHGEFLIAPTNHLRGKGCKPCLGPPISFSHITYAPPINTFGLNDFFK